MSAETDSGVREAGIVSAAADFNRRNVRQIRTGQSQTALPHSFFQSLETQPALSLRSRLYQAFFEDAHRHVHLGLGDDERRTEAEGVAAATEQQEALVEGEVHDLVPTGGVAAREQVAR